MSDTPVYHRITTLAIQIILANCATPLLGLIDTAVMDHIGSAARSSLRFGVYCFCGGERCVFVGSLGEGV